jgi:hypothetical protein
MVSSRRDPEYQPRRRFASEFASAGRQEKVKSETQASQTIADADEERRPMSRGI